MDKFVKICSYLIVTCGVVANSEELVNIALNKPTYQDGTLTYPEDNRNAIWSSEHAVEGKKNCVRQATYIDYSATALKAEPWWQVDLGGLYNIKKVMVYGQPEKNPSQLKGFRLYLSEVNQTSKETLVYENNSTYPDHGIFTINPENRLSVSSRYVTIYLPNTTNSNRTYPGPLVLCEVEVFISALNIAPTVSLSRSSVLSYDSHNYSEVNVIDENHLSDPDKCDCCWSSAIEYNPWLEAVIPFRAPVLTINVIGRTDKALKANITRNLTGLKIEVDSTMVPDNRILYNTRNNSVTIYPQTATVQKINFTRPGSIADWFLIICEIEINVIACASGQYGPLCENCGKCKLGTVCSSTTGICPDGCQPGFTGDKCDLTCELGRFGYNCSSHCSIHCLNDISQCEKATGTCMQGCVNGYIGHNCTTECPDGKFGPGCNASCSGHCYNDEACIKSTGECLHGCEAGYVDLNCSAECPDDKFGVNCLRSCHCLHGTACRKTDGYCKNGCAFGWTGTNCSKDMNILRTMTEQANTSMSSTAHNWTSDLAIDGDIGPVPDVCHCCSGTQNSHTSWWMVDIGKRVSVNHITVYSRHNEKDYQQLTGFQLYLSNDTETDSFVLLGNNTRRNSGTKYELTFPSIVTRYIRIQRPGVLTLCEVLAYKGECRVGTFGDECSQSCHCADDRSCDAITGHCQSPICKTGWIGLACNQQCPQDTFGDECTQTCLCAEGTCTNDYGICHGECRSGYTGSHCNEECPQDTFGDKCTEKCFCAEGTCTKNYGICHGECRSGYSGSHCNEVDVMKSQNQTNVRTSSEYSNTKVIGGAVGGTLAVLVVIVTISIVVFRSRKRNSNGSEPNYETPEITPARTKTEYDTIDKINDNQDQSSDSYGDVRFSAL